MRRPCARCPKWFDREGKHQKICPECYEKAREAGNKKRRDTFKKLREERQCV